MEEARLPSGASLPQQLDAPAASRLLSEQGDGGGIVLLDVRTPEEHDEVRLSGDHLIDIYDYGFPEQLAALPRESSYLVYCQNGNRSELACQMMRRMGFSSVCNLSGGIRQWVERGLPVVEGED